MKAMSVSDMLRKKFNTIPLEGRWFDMFGATERTGVWLLWGPSGSGKTSFAIQLAAELSKSGKVLYDALETGLNMNFCKLAGLFLRNVERGRFQAVVERREELAERLAKRRSADYVIIDSFQYFGIENIREYFQFKAAFPHKLLIFISHADGKSPHGRPAKGVKYDADQKVMIEGYKAINLGRSIGSGKGLFTIWEERAQEVGIDYK